MKKAIKKVVRGKDGKPQVVYVDANTGQVLQDLSGYEVVEQSAENDVAQATGVQTPITQLEDGTKSNQNRTPVARQVVEQSANPVANRSTGFINLPSQDNSQPINTINGTNDSSQTGGVGTGGFGGMGSRGPQNNYGYVDTPGLVTALGFAPGLVGLAGKAANVGFNANSVAAANAARSDMGLPSMSLGETAMGVAKGTAGQVANVSLGKDNYSVGFNAMSPTGRTNMTPAEASRRSHVMSTPMSLTPKDQVKADEEAFAETGLGKSTGIAGKVQSAVSNAFSGLANVAKDVMNSIFGPSPEASTSTGYSYSSPNDIGLGYGISASSAGFPDAPAAPSQAQSQGAYGNSGFGETTGTGVGYGQGGVGTSTSAGYGQAAASMGAAGIGGVGGGFGSGQGESQSSATSNGYSDAQGLY